MKWRTRVDAEWAKISVARKAGWERKRTRVPSRAESTEELKKASVEMEKALRIKRKEWQKKAEALDETDCRMITSEM